MPSSDSVWPSITIWSARSAVYAPMPTIRVPSAWRTGRQTSSVPRHGTASIASRSSAFHPGPTAPIGGESLRRRVHRHPRALERAAQGDAVADREALPVVVEVRPDRRLAGDRGEPVGPGPQLGLGVVAAPAAVAVVEAHEGPVGRELERLERALGVVPDGQRDLVPAQQLVDLLAEPARVAELEAVATGRQQVEGGGERVVVALEPLRQLPQHRPELRRADERLDALVEAPDPLLDVAQLLHVDQVAARLEREHESGRRLLHPPRDRVARGQAVEGRVDLDGVEDLGVAGEPARLAHALRVEDPAPRAVLPAAAADADGLRGRRRGRGHNASRSACASSCRVFRSCGLRSAAAGWNIGNRVRPSCSRTRPCACVIFVSGAKRASAWRPSGTKSFGRITSSWASSHGRWWATSSAFGSRLPGGRALTPFVMKTSSRCSPASSSSRSSSLPAPPTNGRPDSSSFAPGASPTSMTAAVALPSPGTRFVACSQISKPHGTWSRTSFAIASSSFCRSRLAGLTRRSPARGARASAARPSGRRRRGCC